MSPRSTNPVQRALTAVLALCGHASEGLRLKQVAEACNQSLPTTLRDLQQLEACGWAERVPGHEDRWRLSPRPVQIAFAHQAELDRIKRRLEDLQVTYTRAPK